MADQLVFGMSDKPSMGRDDLVVGSANGMAADLIDAWPNWPSPIALIYGPLGSGKTHLASIWEARSGALRFAGSELADAVPNAQDGKHISGDSLDFEILDETNLFHLINAVKQAGVSLLINAASAPDYAVMETPDLVSRFKTATILSIGQPDDMMFMQMIMKLFSDRQMHVDRSVIDYIVQHAERSAAAAVKIVDDLDKLALARKKSVTRTLVREFLGEDIHTDGQLPL